MKGSWLEFIEIPNPGKKTKIWQIWHKDRDPNANYEWEGFLGEIRFYPPWRQYCFCPGTGRLGESTIWSVSCLQQINQFITDRMSERSVINAKGEVA